MFEKSKLKKQIKELEIEVEKEFNLKDFEIWFTATGKLGFKHVRGGVILIPTEFSIKEQKIISKFSVKWYNNYVIKQRRWKSWLRNILFIY